MNEPPQSNYMMASEVFLGNQANMNEDFSRFQAEKNLI